MCNEAARRIELGLLRDDFSQLRIPLSFPEGAPNMEPLPSFRITDLTVIVRAAPGGGAELVTRRWSWPGAGGRPVYNYRSDGRDLRVGRCLIPVDAFFEFTAPADPAVKRKTRWACTKAGEPWFCLAGLWRAHPTAGEAFTMVTCPPGLDIASVHARQVVVVERTYWARWLDGSASSESICQPAPAGTLEVRPA